MSLIGYSIGKRPYYEALLSTIKKVWPLKGSLTLLTLDDGFFLLKFSALEDYEHAWSGGPWFFFGKPFILQKWSPDFVPKRKEFPSIPLWIKIMNLPLSLWTSVGISKLASCIGIPIAVDGLTASKTRLTFARVCVQVTSDSQLPEEIFYSVDGKTFPLRVHYDWKPERCTQCGSIMHSPTLCPKDPVLKTTTVTRPRGRSSSRKPRITPPPKLAIPKPIPTLKLPKNSANPPLLTLPPPSQDLNTGTSLPNLNSPSEENLENIQIASMTQIAPPLNTKNNFDVLASQGINDNTPNINPSHDTSTHLAFSNHDSPRQTSPRNHQPVKPQTSSEPSTSSSTSTKLQQTNNQNQKQTRGKQAKKASTPTSKNQ
ncbi:hypothetical protein KFK09_028842 [Dendrobium nobile]|uniref:DUF4283 domain-containing protein n=1 Tax=Dendrobium nobile TaxID=94219 RepID=A0A8T3A461_DENNO|nr:hypothetical protein KFK09_028842 [Dendrobium nobile]